MRRARAGFTIMELIIALSVASLAVMASIAAMGPVIQTQVALYRNQRAQAEALVALKAVQAELLQSTELYAPAAGAAADSVSGCANYSAALGGPLDAAKPVRAYQICLSGSTLYRYASAACPMAAAACGTGKPEFLATNIFHQTGQPFVFTRSVQKNLVQARYVAKFTGVDAPIDAEYAIQAAGGALQ